MQMPTCERTLQVEGKVLTSDFKIGNAGLIMEYMTKNIYSNPVASIVREIASNSRDAHREAGHNLPIMIKLPNRLEPTIEFKDYGIGITQDRMENIFINYGNSTKRDDNTQTGGFGIGSKTPWSYTDTFVITTTTNEGGTLYRRQYAAVKGADYTCKLIGMGDEVEIDINDPLISADEKRTGTTISFVVKQENFNEFAQNVINYTRFWKIKPIITGCNPLPVYDPEPPTIHTEDNSWIVYERGCYNTNVCVDGIPYPLNTSNLGQNLPDSIQGLFRYSMTLFFNVGELNMSLNREQLQYDQKTKKAIIARLEEINNTIAAKIIAKIENAPSLWEANYMYRENLLAFNSHIKTVVFWNKIAVTGNTIDLCEHGQSNFLNAYEYFLKSSYRTSKVSIRNDQCFELKFSTKHIWVIADEEKICKAKLWTLFDMNPNVDNFRIQVIHPRYLYAFAGDDLAKLDNKAKWEKFADDNNFLQYKDHFILLSTIAKKVMPRNTMPGTKRTPRTVMDARACTSGHYRFDRENAVDLAKGSGYYIPLERGKPEYDYMDKKLNRQSISCLTEAAGMTDKLYGFNEKQIPKLGSGWIPFENLVKKAYDDNKPLYISEIKKLEFCKKNASLTLGNVEGISDYEIKHNDISKEITNPDSTFLKMLAMDKKIKKGEEKNIYGKKFELLSNALRIKIDTVIDMTPDPECQALFDKFVEKYAFLKIINSYDLSHKETRKIIADLINMIDKNNS